MVHLLRRLVSGPDYGHGGQSDGGDYPFGTRRFERPDGTLGCSGGLPSFGESGAWVRRNAGVRWRVGRRSATGPRSSRLPVLIVQRAGRLSKRVAVGAPPGWNGGGRGVERQRC